MRNATSCRAQALTVTFTSTLGERAGHGAYQAGDCGKVPFTPKLAGITGTRKQLKKFANPAVTSSSARARARSPRAA